jgi:hypothetical protein
MGSSNSINFLQKKISIQNLNNSSRNAIFINAFEKLLYSGVFPKKNY